MHPNRALLLFAHPYLHRSRANLALRNAVEGIAGLVIRDLYESYPDFYIDVALEQQALRDVELVIFQHPIYWYSAPAMLKQWQDCVLAPGFAFGHGERALEGKRLWSVITAGHSERSYEKEGYDRFVIGDFLRPFEQTARHCGMAYLPPLVIYDADHCDGELLQIRAAEYRDTLQKHLGIERPEKIDGR